MRSELVTLTRLDLPYTLYCRCVMFISLLIGQLLSSEPRAPNAILWPSHRQCVPQTVSVCCPCWLNWRRKKYSLGHIKLNGAKTEEQYWTCAGVCSFSSLRFVHYCWNQYKLWFLTVSSKLHFSPLACGSIHPSIVFLYEWVRYANTEWRDLSLKYRETFLVRLKATMK